MIRVVVAEDHSAVRSGFVALLSAPEDLEVVGQAADGAHAVGVVARTCTPLEHWSTWEGF